MSQSAIDAKDVGLSFVTLTNLWHVGSGGRLLQLANVCEVGTSAEEMLDLQNTRRDTTADLAIVSFVKQQFGPVDRVIYNWWGSEASTAKELRGKRSPNLLGLNADGTPYDFAGGTIDYSILDLGGQGKALLPDTAKLGLMLPGLTLQTAFDLYNPPMRNYR